MAEILVKLEEGIFNGHGAHSPGQCVSWDVISTRAIDDIKTEAGEFQSPTQEFLVLYLPSVMLVEHVRDTDFWSVFRMKCLPVRKCLQCLTASIMVSDYFSMDGCFSSLP